MVHTYDCEALMAVPSDPDKIMQGRADNERWSATLRALEDLARDPEETPARRAIAQSAVDSARKGSGAAQSIGVPTMGSNPGHLGNHRGGQFIRSDMEYRGTDQK